MEVIFCSQLVDVGGMSLDADGLIGGESDPFERLGAPCSQVKDGQGGFILAGC